MAKPLEGIRVVDFSTFVAAPVCSRLLADLGARVIKVERPEGDAWRVTGVGYLPSRFSDQENPVFDIYNAGKEHIALNLKNTEGMEIFHKLLSDADVLVTNTRPAALKRLGLDYETLKEKYPRLVYGIVLGYGENGPEKDNPAFDTSAFWARSGFLRDQNPRSDTYAPVQPPYGVGDTVTGYLLMGQICAALVRREKTGMGDYVRSSLMHNGIFAMGTMQIISQPPFGRVFPDTRPGYGNLSGGFQCADGEWIFLSGYSAERNVVIFSLLEREDLLTDPRFSTAAARYTNRDALYHIVRDIFLSKPSDYWLAHARERDLPMTRMGHYSDLATDQQAWANDYLENVTFANGRVDVMPRSPIEMDSVGKLTTRIAPAIGADTDSLLQELGYSNENINQLRQAGAIK